MSILGMVLGLAAAVEAQQPVQRATSTVLKEATPAPLRSRRTLEPLGREEKPTESGLESPPEEDRPKAQPQVRFRVSSIYFEGNSIFSSAQLRAVARPYENREVTLGKLRELCLKIRDLYRARGYILARVGIPPQKIKRGRVKVAISEGRFGKVTVKGNDHYSSEFIERMFSPARRGRVVNQAKVERALLVLKEFPDLLVRAAFDLGREPGTTDCVLVVKDSSPVHVGFDYNNYGDRLVGRNRSGVGLWIGDFVIDGAELYAHATFPYPALSNRPFYQAVYNVPMGVEGDRLLFSYSNSFTRIGSEFEILDMKGDAQLASVLYSIALSRTRKHSSNVNLGFAAKNVRNFIFENQLVSDDRLREVVVGYDGSWIGSDCRTVGSLIATRGLGASLGGMPNDDLLSSRPGVGADDDFSKLNLDLGHLSKLGSDALVLLRLGVQVTTDPLTVPEQFALGGPDSVRGFVQSRFLGDNGYTASAEFRQGLVSGDDLQVQAALFVDTGGARLKAYLYGETPSRNVTGAGFGLRAFINQNVSARLDVGFPVSGKIAGDDDSVVYGQMASRF